jgi:hypothetical protein
MRIDSPHDRRFAGSRPIQDRKPNSVLPSLKRSRTRRLNERWDLQSPRDLPTRLDMVFVETLEQVRFDWPKSLAVERIRIGIAEIGVAMVVLAVLTVLAGLAILILVR